MADDAAQKLRDAQTSLAATLRSLAGWIENANPEEAAELLVWIATPLEALLKAAEHVGRRRPE